MKSDGKFYVYLLTGLMCFVFSCQKNEMLNEREQVPQNIEWNEELWKTLQMDSVFLEIRGLIKEEFMKYGDLDYNNGDEKMQEQRWSNYRYHRDSIYGIISEHLLLLYKRYPLFSGEYYFKLIDEVSASFPLVRSRTTVIGDCSYVRDDYYTISCVVVDFYAFCMGTLCEDCRNRLGDLKYAIPKAINKRVALEVAELHMLYKEFDYFLKDPSYPSCNIASTFADELYQRGGRISSLADKLELARIYAQSPWSFLDLPECPKCCNIPAGGWGSGNVGNEGTTHAEGEMGSDWWGPGHNKIIDKALGDVLTKEQIDALKKGSKDSDSKNYQETEEAYRHAMIPYGQTMQQTIEKMRIFFVKGIGEYIADPSQKNYVILGMVLHMIMDAYSPAHNLKVWKNNVWYYFPHVFEWEFVNREKADKAAENVREIYDRIMKGQDAGEVFDGWLASYLEWKEASKKTN